VLFLNSSTKITAYSACNGLGRKLDEILAQLSRGEHGFSTCPLAVPFDTVCGVIPGALEPPASKYDAYDSRVLRITLLAYSSIAKQVQTAVRRWGASRVAVVLGTSTGGIGVTEAAFTKWEDEGVWNADFDLKRQHSFSAFVDVLADVAQIQGPRYVVSTACSSSAKSIASARRLMDADLIDAAVVGGVDSLCLTTVRGFHSLGVLSETPCRPFAKDRAGINVGEAGALMLLEREGVGPSVLGVGESSDAFHMSAPDPEGGGAKLAMRRALADAGLDASQVDHINAHGTGTVRNDSAEAKAILEVFGGNVPVISTKGYTGHLLGAAGGTEAIFCLLALENNWIPKSVGAEALDDEIKIQIAQEKIERPLHVALSNSFAFGGNNISVIFGDVK
jgi:3-oxoacyl-[acyl-carrier-protein] synthase-1